MEVLSGSYRLSLAEFAALTWVAFIALILGFGTLRLTHVLANQVSRYFGWPSMKDARLQALRAWPLLPLLAMTLFGSLGHPHGSTSKGFLEVDLKLREPQAPVVLPPEGPRKNLVLIYVESIERDLMSADLWGRNLLHDLDNSTEDWTDIELFPELYASRSTIDAMVASQCGFAPSQLRDLDFEPGYFASGKFQCLGEILAEDGYNSIFLGGASLEFQNKGAFLRQRGVGEVYGREDWELVFPDSQMSRWGLDDRRLLSVARDTVDRLESENEPYFLSVLTADSHTPGLPSDYCGGGREYSLPAIITCSTTEVATFLKYLETNGYLQDTVVVVLGDHPVHESENSGLLNQASVRHQFMRIYPLDRTLDTELTDFDSVVTLYDVSPTILELMDFEFQGSAAIGFGRSFQNSGTNQLSSEAG